MEKTPDFRKYSQACTVEKRRKIILRNIYDNNAWVKVNK